MVHGVPVKSLLPTADLEFTDQSGLGQDLEIPIHGCQADTRQFFLDAPVQLISGRVVLAPSQFMEHNLPLVGHAQGSMHGHLLSNFPRS